LRPSRRATPCRRRPSTSRLRAIRSISNDSRPCCASSERSSAFPGEGHPFPIEPRYLGDSDSWTLATAAGDLDVFFRPGGTNGFDDLRRDALEVRLRGTPVRLASLRDLIRMKEATGREQDLAQLPALRRTLELSRLPDAEEH
jgi:hypothetical protein